MGTEAQIFNYITDLLPSTAGSFASIGQAMFTGFATIMIVWFGDQVRPHRRRGGGRISTSANLPTSSS